jgi:hypothetical protein
MTIDERLEALTMNLELAARDIAELQKNTADFERATERRFAQWEFEKKHLDEKVDLLVDGTQNLLAAVQGQQIRIERLERHIS